MKKKHISKKKIQTKKGGACINGNCFVKKIDHFKFRDSFLHTRRELRSFKKLNSIVWSSYYLEEKGWEITNREEEF